jgi:uncharacterized damage-inducible protein DinB
MHRIRVLRFDSAISPGGNSVNADDFRELFEYHFAANRKVWNEGVSQLTNEAFLKNNPYSIGSVRNQVVHMMNIDNRWFSGLRGAEVPSFLNPAHYPSPDVIREKWDRVEAHMRTFLQQLDDDQLVQDFGDNMKTWQVLFHVLNHGTDHRAQLLAMLNQLGVDTFPQDYAFFVWGKM